MDLAYVSLCQAKGKILAIGEGKILAIGVRRVRLVEILFSKLNAISSARVHCKGDR